MLLFLPQRERLGLGLTGKACVFLEMIFSFVDATKIALVPYLIIDMLFQLSNCIFSRYGFKIQDCFISVLTGDKINQSVYVIPLLPCYGKNLRHLPWFPLDHMFSQVSKKKKKKPRSRQES